MILKHVLSPALPHPQQTRLYVYYNKPSPHLDGMEQEIYYIEVAESRRLSMLYVCEKVLMGVKSI